MPEFHRLNKSRTAEMNSEELKKKLNEEAARSAANNKKKKQSVKQSRKQQKISEQVRKQLPPQSPARKRREEEMRRQEKEAVREKRRRRRGGSNIIYYVMLAILAVIVFSILSVTVLFNTEQIVVAGESDYTDEQIIAASGLVGDENLVRLNLSGIPEKMLDKLVTLDSVKVEKSFPSTIKITVERSVPMANFSYGGKNYVISHIGRVMNIGEDEADCMHVIGYKPAESVTVGGFITSEDPEQDKLVSDISAAIEKAGINNITTVNISDSLGIVLTYEDRVELYIGSSLRLDEKMTMAYELLNNGYIADTEYVRLDISASGKGIQRPLTSAVITSAPVTSDEEYETAGDGEEEPAEEGGGENTE